MKDELLKSKSTENAIVNLDISKNSGTHWVCYYKYKKNYAVYFDSYGVQPPIEIVNDLNCKNIQYNETKIQRYDDPPVCGHLCLIVLKLLSCGLNFCDILSREYLLKFLL